MAIFGKNKNQQAQALPYVDGLYPADPTGNALVSNAINDYTGGSGVNYVNPETTRVFNLSIETTEQPFQEQVSEGIWLMDIAQSHHYTVQLSGMSMSTFKVPSGSFSQFLPVKTMNLKYTSYENMSIPVAIFGDFPLLNKKRVSTIDLSCYDLDSNKLEYELRQWEAQCFPKGRFVAYMDDIARKFTYKGYSVEGKQTLNYEVYVIPAGNVTVSRDYSANEAKMVNFSLVVVGDGRTCATGEGKQPGVTPIVDHGGAGNGQGSGPFHTLYATGWGKWNPKTESFDL